MKRTDDIIGKYCKWENSIYHITAIDNENLCVVLRLIKEDVDFDQYVVGGWIRIASSIFEAQCEEFELDKNKEIYNESVLHEELEPREITKIINETGFTVDKFADYFDLNKREVYEWTIGLEEPPSKYLYFIVRILKLEKLIDEDWYIDKTLYSQE